MERESESPEIESNERAGSLEPSSARPNPFKDDGESLRKRRRTSVNVDSRSLSVESNASSPCDVSGSEPTALSHPFTIGELDDSAMAVDDGPTSPGPCTPNNIDIAATIDSSPAVPVGGAPSHAALSLRTPTRHPQDTNPSSPSQNPTPNSRPRGQDVAKKALESVESSVESHQDVVNQTTALSDTVSTAQEKPGMPSVSQSRTSSPLIEVVDIVSDDENDKDERYTSAVPQVTILSDNSGTSQNLVVPDPSGDFPYLSNGELPSDIIMLLMGPLTQGMLKIVEFSMRFNQLTVLQIRRSRSNSENGSNSTLSSPQHPLSIESTNPSQFTARYGIPYRS